MIDFNLINTILFWIGVYVLSWYGLILIFNRCIPNIKTAPAIRKTIFDLIKKDVDKKNKDTYTVIDLGCADGTFARDLARTHPHIQIIGIDTSPLDIAKARILNRLFGFNNIKYINQNFMTYDIKQADAVCMFLISDVMAPVGEKLKKEATKDTLITSNRFALGGDWAPDQVIEVDTLAVNQKQLYIYRA